MRVAVGADALGRELKQQLTEHLGALGHDVIDVNADQDPEIDYPEVAVAAASAVLDGQADRALLMCGTGIGMAIAANKIPGIRAANVSDAYSAERAAMSNDAQVLCLGGQVIGLQHAKLLVERWLQSRFAGGRSARKVAKLIALDDRPAHPRALDT
jgi:ribose 5-phosphate isomerase B